MPGRRSVRAPTPRSFPSGRPLPRGAHAPCSDATRMASPRHLALLPLALALASCDNPFGSAKDAAPTLALSAPSAGTALEVVLRA